MNKSIASFDSPASTISKDLAADGGGWRADCAKAATFRLFEVPNPGVENCRILYRARVRTDRLTGRAHLEMWCRFPGRGEFFSRGLNQAVSGSNDWISCEIPFFLKQGEAPDLIRLNLVVKAEGWLFKRQVSGRVWIKDIRLESEEPSVPS